MTAEEEAASRLRNQVLMQTQQETAVPPEIIEEVVSLMANRLDVDPLTDVRPRLLVFTTWAAARAAATMWVEQGGTGTLSENMRLAFEYMLTGWRSI